MKLNLLKPAEGSTHKKKRLGRGESSGKGGTSTKGNKGIKQRAGYSRKNAHEGGQMPIQRRIPKRGFKNTNKQVYKLFNLGQVKIIKEKFSLSEFSLEALLQNKLISKNDKIKILSHGQFDLKLNFKVNSLSIKSKEIIESLGGTIETFKN